jgi:formamidopyrimidine-DNA glycosylase
MPEGHTIRHLATVLSYGYAGTFIEASSPQGRFADGAAKINNRVMTATSAHGKHLFLHFDEDIVHIHLGLYGWIKNRKNKCQAPTDATRLRIMNSEYLSDLSGPTVCKIISHDERNIKLNALGPDPIHEGADLEKAWTKIHKSSKTIGGLLMDQSIIAGIGNVYRAEILFLNNLSPFIPGKDVTREKFDSIWNDSVRLLRLGAEDGHIRTVDPKHLTGVGVELHGTEHYSYVYKQTGCECLLCGDRIMSDMLDSRTVYWCPNCQQ